MEKYLPNYFFFKLNDLLNNKKNCDNEANVTIKLDNEFFKKISLCCLKLHAYFIDSINDPQNFSLLLKTFVQL